ncbi:unnamed protein product [Amoebophrya sp. A25]|nr:unnamed protein product [Amoebophrya sp. A25]|eukprot:GSA25T00025850001.1
MGDLLLPSSICTVGTMRPSSSRTSMRHCKKMLFAFKRSMMFSLRNLASRTRSRTLNLHLRTSPCGSCHEQHYQRRTTHDMFSLGTIPTALLGTPTPSIKAVDAMAASAGVAAQLIVSGMFSGEEQGLKMVELVSISTSSCALFFLLFIIFCLCATAVLGLVIQQRCRSKPINSHKNAVAIITSDEEENSWSDVDV